MTELKKYEIKIKRELSDEVITEIEVNEFRNGWRHKDTTIKINYKGADSEGFHNYDVEFSGSNESQEDMEYHILWVARQKDKPNKEFIVDNSCYEPKLNQDNYSNCVQRAEKSAREWELAMCETRALRKHTEHLKSFNGLIFER